MQQKLTDRIIRNIKPEGKEREVNDGGGLYIVIKPSGSKNWIFRYSCLVVKKKRRKIGLGGYPSVSLAKAREAAKVQRELVAQGIDPHREREREQQRLLLEGTNTFGLLAEAWFEWKLKRGDWTAEDSRTRVRGLLDNHILPWLRDKPLADITRREVAVLLQRVADQGLKDTPHRCRWVIEQVFNYAVEFGEFPDEKNFMRGRDVGALKRHKTQHHATILDPERIGQLVRDIRTVRGTLLTRTALALLPYVWQRPGMVRKMEWRELEFDAALWKIPSEKMKMDEEHVVPLPRQAVELLRDLQPLTGQDGRGPVFPNLSRQERKASPFMSENTMNKALQRAGYDTQKDVTGHGFRAMARTILPEELGIPKEWAERHLSHVTKEENGAAYDRAKYLKRRAEMVQLWADWLDYLADGGDPVAAPQLPENVVPLRLVA